MICVSCLLSDITVTGIASCTSQCPVVVWNSEQSSDSEVCSTHDDPKKGRSLTTLQDTRLFGDEQLESQECHQRRESQR